MKWWDFDIPQIKPSIYSFSHLPYISVTKGLTSMKLLKKKLNLLLLWLALSFTSSLAIADTSMINYQGYLSDNTGQALDGTANISLSFWNALTNGSQMGATKSFPNTEVNNGLFSQYVNVSDVNFDGDVYIEITVNGETLTPRQLVTNVQSSVQDILSTLDCAADQIIQSTGDSWACANLPQANAGSSLPAADYDSGWFTMKSQAGTNSFKQLTHGLGVYPSRVKVLVKAIDGENEGFIFEGTGAAQNDDDIREYGGVLFAYNDWQVRLWTPDRNNNRKNGRIINIADGWGGEMHSQASHEALVKVLAWR